MRILREGSEDCIWRYVKFECDNCGCIFEANKEEYKYHYGGCGDDYYIINCPFCNEQVKKWN